MNVRSCAVVIGIVAFSFLIVHNHSGAQGGERILSFHSDITIHADGSMTVREAIRVRSIGNKIKRGIYRDFPTRYKGRHGEKYVVPFNVERVTRDGRTEGYHTRKQSKGVRVYMGREKVTLPPGEHTYGLTYRTNRQLGFFKNHDELYWNVTGNDWAFPIDTASATVRLPAEVGRTDMSVEAYTGPKGSKGRAYEATVEGPGVASFRTTKMLLPTEGFTIVVGFPKGIVPEPTAAERVAYTLNDNRGGILGVVGLLCVFFYYVVVWSMVGKDPEKGIILPQDAPPSGFSPAALRFIWRMGFDNQTFTTTLVNMASKGFLRIEEQDGTYYLVRDQAPPNVLTPEETKIADKLLGQSQEFEIDQKHHATLSKAQQNLRRALQKNCEKVYFLTNKKYLLPGILLSIAVVVGAAALSLSAESGPTALFMTIWLTGWTVGVAALLRQVVVSWKAVFAGSSKQIGPALGITLLSVPFVGGELLGAGFLYMATSAGLVAAIVALGVINLVFYQLLKAPTRLGRKVLDQIEGFRMSLTGEGSFNMGGDAEQASRLFEQYLPFAIALGVEQGWSKQFSEALTEAGKLPHDDHYSPRWYRGPHWQAVGADGFASALNSSFASAVSSSSTAPGSSSGGGGGGSSGGGGGGGGGGGW